MDERQWPLIKDLPEDERMPFYDWLTHQARPINHDGTVGYYPIDYEAWKAGLPPLD